MGPVTDPKLQTPLNRPKYRPRSLKGIKSAKMTSVVVIIPPPPKPWNARPISNAVKFVAQLATIVPARKNAKARSMTGFLPTILEKAAKVGWKTVRISDLVRGVWKQANPTCRTKKERSSTPECFDCGAA